MTKRLWLPLTAAALCMLAGCPGDDDPAPSDDAGEGGGGNGGRGGASGQTAGGRGGRDAPSTGGGDAGVPCPDGYECVKLVEPPSKLDLLFMVDNSKSMASSQAALSAQLPSLFEGLTGDTAAVSDIHVGVVSSDMGIPGVNYPPCLSNGGDDGKLQRDGHGDGCEAVYPAHFLSYNVPGEVDSAAVASFAHDVGCIANLGTGGCGFEQQLESPFKALWPSVYQDPDGKVVTPNPYTFLSTMQSGTLGRGDIPNAQGGNLGFLRNDRDDPSVIALVVITDEEDCSVMGTEHLKPTNQLPDDSPYRNEAINLRCYYHPEFSFSVQQRYYDGFRMLRPGHEERVVFGAIAGVPPELVSAEALAEVDFAKADSRNTFYRKVLDDSRMQYQPDEQEDTPQGNLVPACSHPVGEEGTPAVAYPARRIVELAKLFGENGIVQSICQDDFSAPLAAILGRIGRQFQPSCVAEVHERASDGKIACNVVWELPPTAANETTPVSCDDRTFLIPVGEGGAARNSRGGENCRVEQIGVENREAPTTAQGWYYDDFTPALEQACGEGRGRRVAFTDEAKPPSGVVVSLQCKRDVQ